MAPKELAYTHHGATSGEHAATFFIMVDEDAYKKYQTDKSIPLAQVVDSFQVLRYEHGRSGVVEKPSQREIEDVFGTKNDDEVVKMMLERGKIH
jgi:ribosome maturation protein Sdo1